MENNKKDRTQLKSYFKSNAVPTEQNFKDLIDANLNQKEDGIAKIPNGALAIQSASTTEELIHFYKSFDDPNPTWKLNQKPGDRAGFNISDGTGTSRLFIDAGNGNVGLSAASPAAKLDVNTIDGNGVLIRSGNGAFSTVNSQLTFGFEGTAQYRHALKTRHHGGQLAGNAIDFFVWKFGTDGVDAIGTQQVMTLDGNGNVGIGNNTPSAKLHITAGGDRPESNGVYVFNPSNAASQSAVLCARVGGTEAGNPYLSLDVQGKGGWSIGVDNKESQALKFSAAWDNLGANKMTLDRSGNLGIGVSPTAKLDVNVLDGNGVQIRSGNSAAAYANSQLTFGYNGLAQFRHALKTRHHAGQLAGNAIDFFVWKQGADAAESVGTQHVMSIDGNGGGSVGIGTKSPTAKLHVIANGADPTTNGMYVYNDQTSTTKDAILAARVSGPAAGSPYISLDVKDAGGWSIGVDSSDGQALKFSNKWNGLSSPSLTIDRSSGNVGIGRRPLSSGAMKLEVPAGSTIGTTDGNSNQHAEANRGTKVRFGSMTSEFAGMSVIVKEGTNGCGNSSDVLFSTWECNTSLSREVMSVTGRGFVGIGTSSPRWPLHVVGSIKTGPANGNGAKMDYDRYDNGWDNGKAADISIMADNVIASRTYFVCHEKFNSSDARIKNVIGRSNPLEDLAVLRQVPVTDYKYIDTRTQGTGVHKKIIAQELEAIYAPAVRKRVETIPNIYADAVSSSFEEATKILTLEMDKAPELEAGDFVDLIGNNGRDLYSVLSVEGTTFRVKAESDPGNVFVFGKQVDDFRIVDYDALFMLGISSIQALSNEVDNLKEEVSGLKKALAAYSA